MSSVSAYSMIGCNKLVLVAVMFSTSVICFALTVCPWIVYFLIFLYIFARDGLSVTQCLELSRFFLLLLSFSMSHDQPPAQ